MHVRPAKNQISLGICPVCSESSLSAQWVAMDPKFLHVHSEDWSDRANAQVDLSLRWAHSQFVGFVMLWIIYLSYFRLVLLTIKRKHSDNISIVINNKYIGFLTLKNCGFYNTCTWTRRPSSPCRLSSLSCHLYKISYLSHNYTSYQV